MSRPESHPTVTVTASHVELAVIDRQLVLLQARRALARGRQLLAADRAADADRWDVPLSVALSVLTARTEPAELVARATEFGLCIIGSSSAIPAPR